MRPIQRWRASNTYTETEWAALLADATRRRAFSRGAFALVVADLDGGFVALYCKGQTGTGVSSFKLIATGVAEIPAPPADVLLDAAAPNTNVRLGVAGVGAAISDAALLALLVAEGAVDLATAQDLENKTLFSPRIYEALHSVDGSKVADITGINNADSFVELTAGDMPASPPRVSAGGTGADVNLDIRAKGLGFVQPRRLLIESGTIANITGGVGTFATPSVGQMAFASDHVPPVPCWYSGTQWVHASGLPL
jgi:hypothetical protein